MAIEKVSRSLAPQQVRRGMQRFLKQKTSENYREQLAKERAEAERVYPLTLLARKEAENRRRSAGGWVIVEARRRLVESR
jgi:hypothetical protein